MKISGRHLATMVVAVSAAAVLAPVSVNAATGSFVNIRDPFSSASSGQARVTSGALAVTEDLNSFTRVGNIYDDGISQIVITVPANKRLNLGTLVLGHWNGSGSVRVDISRGKPSSTCAATGRTGLTYFGSFPVSPGEVKSINYSPRLSMAPVAYTTCVDVYVTGGGGGTNMINATLTGTLA